MVALSSLFILFIKIKKIKRLFSEKIFFFKVLKCIYNLTICFLKGKIVFY